MTQIVKYKDTISPSELEKHRVWIAVQSEALMARYFQVQVDPVVKKEIVRGWMDTLQDYSQDEIYDAIKSHIHNKPNLRPHEGMIRQTIIDNRKSKTPPSVPLPEPQKDIPSLERRKELVKQANQILKGTGIKFKSFRKK